MIQQINGSVKFSFSLSAAVHTRARILCTLNVSTFILIPAPKHLFLEKRMWFLCIYNSQVDKKKNTIVKSTTSEVMSHRHVTAFPMWPTFYRLSIFISHFKTPFFSLILHLKKWCFDIFTRLNNNLSAFLINYMYLTNNIWDK